MHSPFHKVLRSLSGETVVTVTSIDLPPNLVLALFLRVIVTTCVALVSEHWVLDSRTIRVEKTWVTLVAGLQWRIIAHTNDLVARVLVALWQLFNEIFEETHGEGER